MALDKGAYGHLLGMFLIVILSLIRLFILRVAVVVCFRHCSIPLGRHQREMGAGWKV